MSKKTIGTFTVDFLQVMDEKGKVDAGLMPKISNADVLKLYELMVLTRAFDDKAFKLQRQGRIGTYSQSLGQEAVVIGSSFAMQQQDWVFPAFREHGVYIARGMPIAQYYQYWAGDERGMKIPEGVNMFTVSVPVSTHLPHAVGCAWAMKLKGEKAASVVFFGDGATSKGDFHEAMNFAGVLKAPCVFICQNNQWAISVPFTRQTAAQTVAQKAIAYGFDGIRVDGNDVFAVYSAVKQALEKARSGNGPTLVECLTYRMGDHTTSDDAKRYRTEEDVESWRQKDPITRLEKYMLGAKIFTESDRDRIYTEAAGKIEAAVKELETVKPANPSDIFNYVYAKLPPDLEEQKNDMLEGVHDNTENSDGEEDGGDDDNIVHAQ